jgi:hypothetical protein
MVRSYYDRQKVLTENFITNLTVKLDGNSILKDVHYHLTNYAIQGTEMICK